LRLGTDFGVLAVLQVHGFNLLPVFNKALTDGDDVGFRAQTVNPDAFVIGF